MAGELDSEAHWYNLIQYTQVRRRSCLSADECFQVSVHRGVILSLETKPTSTQEKIGRCKIIPKSSPP